MLEQQELKRAWEKVHRRKAILDSAIDELDVVMGKIVQQAETKIISRKLKIVDIAMLLEVTPRTIARWGLNKQRTYEDAHNWIKVNRPELQKRLEENYKKALKEEKL
jgi:deoxyribodipyrimidine photolyase-like uncharacterized protein